MLAFQPSPARLWLQGKAEWGTSPSSRLRSGSRPSSVLFVHCLARCSLVSFMSQPSLSQLPPSPLPPPSPPSWPCVATPDLPGDAGRATRGWQDAAGSPGLGRVTTSECSTRQAVAGAQHGPSSLPFCTAPPVCGEITSTALEGALRWDCLSSATWG